MQIAPIPLMTTYRPSAKYFSTTFGQR